MISSNTMIAVIAESEQAWTPDLRNTAIDAGADYLLHCDNPEQIALLIRRTRLRSLRTQADALVSDTQYWMRELKALEEHTMILHLNSQDEVVGASPRYCQVSGYSCEELIGSKVWDGIAESHTPLDPEEIRAALRKGTNFECEIARNRVDGSRYWLHVLMVPFLDEDGEFIACVALCNDITRRKEAQTTLRMMVEAVRHSPDGIAITDLSGNITCTNPALAVMIGYEVKDLVGRHADVLLAPENATDLPPAPWRASSGSKTKIVRRMPTLVRKDGTRLSLQETISPIRSHDRKPIGFVVTLRDVTRERIAEQQLYEAQKMESLGTLAGGIAHDFKNILNPIFGYVDLLQTKLPQESKEATWLSRIRSAGERAHEVVERILGFSQRGGIERVEVNLARICADTVPLLQAGLTKQIPLSVELSEDGTTIVGDSDQLRQVLLALGANALYALRRSKNEGTINLRVYAKEVTREQSALVAGLKSGPWVVLEMEDNGSGIPAEKLSRIFDPYYTTKPLNEGSGMGLSAVQGIVRGHAGAISVESKEDIGTRMVLYFPPVKSKSQRGGEGLSVDADNLRQHQASQAKHEPSVGEE